MNDDPNQILGQVAEHITRGRAQFELVRYVREGGGQVEFVSLRRRMVGNSRIEGFIVFGFLKRFLGHNPLNLSGPSWHGLGCSFDQGVAVGRKRDVGVCTSLRGAFQRQWRKAARNKVSFAGMARVGNLKPKVTDCLEM
jgi:hypothetical protein